MCTNARILLLSVHFALFFVLRDFSLYMWFCRSYAGLCRRHETRRWYLLSSAAIQHPHAVSSRTCRVICIPQGCCHGQCSQTTSRLPSITEMRKNPTSGQRSSSRRHTSPSLSILPSHSQHRPSYLKKPRFSVSPFPFICECPPQKKGICNGCHM